MPSTQIPMTLQQLAEIRQQQGVGHIGLENMLRNANVDSDDARAQRIMEVMLRHSMENRRAENGELVSSSPRMATKRKPGALEAMFNFLSGQPVVDELQAVQREYRGR